jgi:uncharacterized repeat protein (TIGR01451 family)
MKSLQSTLRLVAPLVVVFCFLCADSQSLQAQQTFSFPDFSSHANLRINGNAAVATDAHVLRLTPAMTGQDGTAWYATSLSLKSGFTTTFTFRFTGAPAVPANCCGAADGIAFVIQNGSFPNLSNGSLAQDPSAAGGGIGFQGLTHSLAVELDTFCNPQNSDTCIGNNFSSANEVAILSCGSDANSASHALCGINLANVATPIADGGMHTAVITYTPPGDCTECLGTLAITLDSLPVLSTNFNLANLGLDPEQDAFVGFTAATGAGFENQDILSWSFNASQTGNTIDPGVPGSLIQTFHFGGAEGSNQVDDYDFNYSIASQAESLTVQPGTTPFITNLQITPADWPAFVNGTPFATTMCIPINGANGNCTAKRQVCTISPGDTPTGDKCPQSTVRNILLSADFDAPAFPDGTIFGATEATDDWPGGACTFPSGEAENGKSCPQNTLVSFTGPGQYTGRRGGASTNSTGVIYTNLIPPTTTVTGFVNSAGWTNSTSPTGFFTGNPPQLPASNTNNMTDPPVASITYGVNNLPADQPTLHPTDLPITGDIVIPNPAACPATLTNVQQPPFGPNQVTLLGPTFMDGTTHQLHYFTTDCSTTEELKFTKDPTTHNWSTSFNSLTIKVDLTNPTVSSGPTLSPAPTTNNGVPNSYLINQPVTATYTCTDPPPSRGPLPPSGLATCNSFPVAGALPSATFSNQPVATSAAGSFNYTVAGPTDVAGNIGLSASVPYTVVDQPVNLDLFYLAPSKIKPGSNLTYFIAAVNLTQKNVASGVTITDIAPAGTTVVSAVFDKISCSFFGCSIPNRGTSCSVSINVITCNIGSLAPFNTLTGVGVVIVVKVPAATPLNTVLSDTATATSLNRDSDGRDNSVRITTIVKN